jgi:uncharacterized protein YjbI with pentapeptide repeats
MLSNPSLIAIILPIAVLLPLPAQAFNPDHLTQLLKTNQCPNCDLSGANLEKANLSNANLIGTNLQSATLTGANLSNANLEGANVKGASVNDAYLYRANLTSTNFSNASLQKANLRETTLVGTNFSSADLRSADFQGNNLAQAMFSSANLSSANLSYIRSFIVINLRTQQTESLSLDSFYDSMCTMPELGSLNALDDWQATESLSAPLKFSRVDFAGTNLSDANLQGSTLIRTDLRKVDLSRANLRSACLVAVNLSGTKLEKADLKNIRLIATELPDGVSQEPIAALFPKPAPKPAIDRPDEAQAKQYVATLNRAQQAYYLENNRVTNQFDDLQTGLSIATPSYRYRLFIAPNRYPAALHVGLPKDTTLHTFLGFVNIRTITEGQFKGETTTHAILCVSDKPATPMPLWTTIDYQRKETQPIPCPKGFTPVK